MFHGNFTRMTGCWVSQTPLKKEQYIYIYKMFSWDDDDFQLNGQIKIQSTKRSKTRTISGISGCDQYLASQDNQKIGFKQMGRTSKLAGLQAGALIRIASSFMELQNVQNTPSHFCWLFTKDWSTNVPRERHSKLFPIGSMYAIYGNIYHQYTPNVSINLPYDWILWVLLIFLM